MKEIKAFECEVCHAIYESDEKASLCEASHAKNIQVVNAWFDAGRDCPSSIEIEWTDSKGKSRGGVWERQ